MKTDYVSGVVFYLSLMALLAGCATQSADTNMRQADIGLGIVEGTKGLSANSKRKTADEGTDEKGAGAGVSDRRGSVCRAHERADRRSTPC